MNNNAIIADRHCCNCTHFGTDDGQCTYRMLPESVACKNLEPKQAPKERQQLAIPIADHVQRLLVCKEKSYEKGYIMAQLQLMYEAACQQLPNYRNEWTRVKEMCANGLRELWKTDDSKK